MPSGFVCLRVLVIPENSGPISCVISQRNAASVTHQLLLTVLLTVCVRET